MRGHNLGLRYLAVEERTRVRVLAQPNLAKNRKYVLDTFMTRRRFTELPTWRKRAKGRAQI
jgi:hypothetical protein